MGRTNITAKLYQPVISDNVPEKNCLPGKCSAATHTVGKYTINWATAYSASESRFMKITE